MNIENLSTVLNKEMIINMDVPENITQDVYEECFSSKDNYIVFKVGNEDITIDFNIYASWVVSNSGGDGYLNENYDEAEDIRIDVELLNVENYETGEKVNLDNVESIKKIEKFISNLIY